MKPVTSDSHQVFPTPHTVDPPLEIAGKLLLLIGAIFATTPIWSYFAAIAIPNLFLITVGGVAFLILGMQILANNTEPPQPQTIRPSPPPSPIKLPTSEELAKELGAPFQHLREWRILSAEEVTRKLAEMLKKAQIGLTTTTKLKGTTRSTPPITALTLQTNSVDIGIAHPSLNTDLNKHAHICQQISFTNKLSPSKEGRADRTQFTAAVLAAFLGKDNEALDQIKGQLIPTLTNLLEKFPLTESGIFNALKLTFPALDAWCDNNSIKERCRLTLVVYLGSRVWVASIDGHDCSVSFFPDTKGQVGGEQATPTLLTVAIDLNNSKFQQSAKKRGGKVETNKNFKITRHAVDGFTDARAIGGFNSDGSKHIGARPKITCLQLAAGYLVLMLGKLHRLYFPFTEVAQCLSENSKAEPVGLATELSKRAAGVIFGVTTMVAAVNEKTLLAVSGSQTLDPCSPRKKRVRA